MRTFKGSVGVFDSSFVVFIKGDGGRIKLDANVLSKISKYIQVEKNMSEAGGVLLGRYIIDSKDIVVDDVTTPMKNDVRQRCYFIKIKSNHQRIVTRRWNKSKGTCNYLGEWHTHPEAVPTPSSIDISEWKRQLRSSKFEDDCLYFIIAGTQKIRVWEGNKNSLEIKLLEKYSEGGD